MITKPVRIDISFSIFFKFEEDDLVYNVTGKVESYITGYVSAKEFGLNLPGKYACVDYVMLDKGIEANFRMVAHEDGDLVVNNDIRLES